MLAKKAGESGMCEADYLRLLISQKPNDYPEVRELLKELINEVNRIGININQIVLLKLFRIIRLRHRKHQRRVKNLQLRLQHLAVWFRYSN